MRRRSAPVPEPDADLAALSIVDGALSTMPRRGAFEREEAELLLRHVASSVGRSDAATAIVESAGVEFGDDRLVDRSRVVDALLDIRSEVDRGRGAPR